MSLCKQRKGFETRFAGRLDLRTDAAGEYRDKEAAAAWAGWLEHYQHGEPAPTACHSCQYKPRSIANG